MFYREKEVITVVRELTATKEEILAFIKKHTDPLDTEFKVFDIELDEYPKYINVILRDSEGYEPDEELSMREYDELEDLLNSLEPKLGCLASWSLYYWSK